MTGDYVPAWACPPAERLLEIASRLRESAAEDMKRAVSMEERVSDLRDSAADLEKQAVLYEAAAAALEA